MNLRCASCFAPMTLAAPICANGHAHPMRNGVLSLLSAAELAQFDARDAALVTFRSEAGLRREDFDFERLPWSASAHPEWAARCEDVKTARRWLPTRHADVLEIGSSNGWLSNLMTSWGHNVTATDLFGDDCDGLAAMERYRNQWRAIRMNVERTDLIDHAFDAIVVNHGVHYLRDPLALLGALLHKLAPGGVLLAIGLRFFRDPSARQRRVREVRAQTRRLSGGDLLNGATRGLLDWRDRDSLRSLGFALHHDKHHLLANARAAVQRQRATHMHATYHRSR